MRILMLVLLSPILALLSSCETQANLPASLVEDCQAMCAASESSFTELSVRSAFGNHWLSADCRCEAYRIRFVCRQHNTESLAKDCKQDKRGTP
jgi:hypothetical protein